MVAVIKLVIVLKLPSIVIRNNSYLPIIQMTAIDAKA
jgi:hypothetical protein